MRFIFSIRIDNPLSGWTIRLMVTQEEPSLIVSEGIPRRALARTMHRFSTAATKSSALPVLHSFGLLNVLQRVRLRGPQSRVAQRTQVDAFVTS